jgi:predicted nucleic acid-binding protein
MIATSVSAAIVIDASVAVWAVMPVLVAQGVDALGRFAAWRQAGIQLFAPTLWLAECTSALRAGVYDRQFSSTAGRTALADLFTLQVELRPLDVLLCQAAFDWAARLRQRRAYDALYLALADQMGTEFWSADQRLVNSARQAGMTRVHWIGES